MKKSEIIAQKILALESSDIIYNIGIPKNVKDFLTIEKVRNAIPIEIYTDGSFSVAVDLTGKEEYCVAILSVTMYNELICMGVAEFRKGEMKYAFENRIKRLKENL